jgi:hypothetical protein
MTNLICRYGVSLALVAAFALAVVTVGNTLGTIQSHQLHQTAAIQCLLDERCSTAIVHGHAVTRRPNPVVQPATTTLI